MKEEAFTVRFVDRKNCFLYFSDIWMQKIVVFQPNILKLCLKMSYGTQNTAYFSPSVQPYSGGDERTVGINATYAQMLGIRETEEVLISSFERATSVNKINVCLLSIEDWEMMEVSLSAIQSSILDQVRIVWPGQTLLVWISKYLHFALRVDDLDPNYEVGVLEQFTDLVVKFPNDEVESNPVDANQVAQTRAASNNSALSDSTGELNNGLYERTEAAGSDAQTNQSSSFSMWDIMKRTFSSVFPQNDDKQITDFNVKEIDLSTLSTLASYKWIPKTVPFRLHPLQIKDSVIDTSNLSDAILRQPFYVFVHKCNLPWEFTNANSTRDILVCQLSRVAIGIKVDEREANDQTRVKTDEDVPQPTKRPAHNIVYARLYVIEDIYNGLSSEVQKILKKYVLYSEHNCILVPHLVQRALRAKIGSRLHLSIAANNSTNLTQIEIIPIGTSIPIHQDLVVLFNEYLTCLARYNSILLNNESVVQISVNPTSTISVLVKLLPSELNFTVLNTESIKRCNIQVSVDNCVHRDDHEDQNEEERCAPFFGQGTSALLDEGSAAIALSLGLRPAVVGLSRLVSNVLVVGPPGSGTSTLCRRLCEAARRPPHFVHRVTVQCRHLKGKTVETLQKQLRQWIADCVHHQPAILVLDDVDAIAGVSSSDGGHLAEEAYSFRVGEMIVDTLKRVQHSNYVLVMATAQSVSKLSVSLAAPRGQHFFKTVLEVPELSQTDRLETLKAVLSERAGLSASAVDSLALSSHVAKADGYAVQDIADMVDKAVFHGWKRTFAQRKPALVLEDCDIAEAMSNTVPLALRGVTLVKDSSQCWADVGGLTDVKQTLVEALQWPSMYAELFARCPLRYQSGLLLYGAPGTGKTLLASAVASECGLNFISVKGPELLSKYIGASEEAVRNIFQKAQSARPCVLFFDEFDSLAPRRGHDSTGVTDRVVNQLLTQLDGVETLVGVWVVAATSRPDLLDPALLRPGRLDRAVLCSLPDEPDRLDILRAQSRKMRLADDVDLLAIAERTDGFTGADLQAVLYTAQMMAVEAACQNAPSDATDGTPCILGEVTQAHLLAALADTRPSLPPDEKLKYKRIYDRFVGQRTGRSKDQGVVSQRVTLA